MRQKKYDVIVVGCGPAGAIAGKFAALNGASTLIIEEKRQIGIPSQDPAGVLYDKSEMEETTGQKIEPSIIHSRIAGLSWVSPKGKQGKPRLLPDAVTINRPAFERSLAVGAIKAGAEVRLHTRVIDIQLESGKVNGVIVKDGTRSTSIPCSMVIAADGSFKHIARQAKLGFTDGPISIPIGYEFIGVRKLKQPGDLVEIYLDDSGEGRFNTVFPHGEDRTFIGCAVARNNIKQNKTLKQRLDEFIKHLEALGRYDFSKASPVSLVAGGMMVAEVPRLAADGIILAGNAAGPPLYGSRAGGRTMMLGACWSGRVAGEISARALRKGDLNGNSLDKEYKDIISASLKGEGANIQEALGIWRQVFTLNPEGHERVLEDLGQEVAALHFYSKGALPMSFCREPLKQWLKENGRAIRR